jgi:hypothetical protein
MESIKMNERLKKIDIDVFLIEIMNKFMSEKKIYKKDNDNILLEDSEEVPNISDTCNQIIQEILREMGYTETLTREDLLTLIVMIENKLSFESIILYMGYFLDNIKSSKSSEHDNLNRNIIKKFYTNDYDYFFITLNETFKVKYKNLKFRDDNYTQNLFHSIFLDLNKMLRFLIDIPLLPDTEVLIHTNQQYLDDDINYQNIYKIKTISTDFLLEHCNKFKNEIYWLDSKFKNGDLVIFKKEIVFGEEPNTIKIQIGEKARIFSYEPISKSNTYKRYGVYYKMNTKPYNYLKLRISEEELLNKDLYDIEKITESCHNTNDEIVKTIEKNKDLFNKLDSQTAGADKKKLSRMKLYFKDKQKSKKCPKHYYNEPNIETLKDDEEKDINQLRHGWNSKKYKDKYYYVNENMCRRTNESLNNLLYDEVEEIIDRDYFNSKYLYLPRESFILDNDRQLVFNLSNHKSELLQEDEKKLNKLWFYETELYPIRIPSNPEYNINEIFDDDDDYENAVKTMYEDVFDELDFNKDYKMYIYMKKLYNFKASKYTPILRSNFSFEKLKCDDNFVIFQNQNHISTEFIHTCIPILWLYKIFDNYYSIHDKDERYEELKTNIFNKKLMKELLICLKRYILLENQFDNETLSFFIILGALQYITNNIREDEIELDLKKTKYYKQKEQPKFSLFDRYYKLNYIIHAEIKGITKNYKNILLKQIPIIFKQIIPFWINKKIEYEQESIKKNSINWTQVVFAALQLAAHVQPYIRKVYPDIFPSNEQIKISWADAKIDELERRAHVGLYGADSPFYNEFKDEFFPKEIDEISYNDEDGFQYHSEIEKVKDLMEDSSHEIIFVKGKWHFKKLATAQSTVIEEHPQQFPNPLSSEIKSYQPVEQLDKKLTKNQMAMTEQIPSSVMQQLKQKCNDPNLQCFVVIFLHGQVNSSNGIVIDGSSPVFYANNNIGSILLSNFKKSADSHVYDYSSVSKAIGSETQIVADLVFSPHPTDDGTENFGISVVVIEKHNVKVQSVHNVVTNQQLRDLASKDQINHFTMKYIFDIKDRIIAEIKPKYIMPTVVRSCLGFENKQTTLEQLQELFTKNNIPGDVKLKVRNAIWSDYEKRHLEGSNKLIRVDQTPCDDDVCKIGDRVKMKYSITEGTRLSYTFDLPEEVGNGTINVHADSLLLWERMTANHHFRDLDETTQIMMLFNLDSVIRTKRHIYKQRFAQATDGTWGRSTRGDGVQNNQQLRYDERFTLKDPSLMQWDNNQRLVKPSFSNPRTLPFKLSDKLCGKITTYLRVNPPKPIKWGGSENPETKLNADSSLIDLDIFFNNLTQIFDVLVDDKILMKSNLDIYIRYVNKLRNQFYKIILLDSNIELFIIYTFRVILELVNKEIIKAELEYSKTIESIKSQINKFNTINTIIETLKMTDWELYYTFNDMNKEEFEKKYNLDKEITNHIIILTWSRYIILNNISLDNIETNYESIIYEIDTNDKFYKNKGKPIFVDDNGNQYTSDLILIGKENTPHSKKEPIVKEQEITIDLEKQTLDRTEHIKIPISDDSHMTTHHKVKTSKEPIEYSIKYYSDSLYYKIYNYENLKTTKGLRYLRFIKENLMQLYNNKDILIELYEHQNNDIKILYDNIQKLYGLTIFTRDLFYTISEHIDKSRNYKFESIIKSINDVRMNSYIHLTIPKEIYSNFSEAFRYPFKDFDGELNGVISKTNLGKNITECLESIQDLIVKIGYQKINKTLFNDIRELPDIDTIKSKTKLEKEESDSSEESKCSIQ